MTSVNIIQIRIIDHKKHIFFYIGDKLYERTIIKETKKGFKVHLFGYVQEIQQEVFGIPKSMQ